MSDIDIDHLSKAVLTLEARLAEIGGCSDGYCVIVRPIGMHTNGGCRCYQDRTKMQRFALYVRAFRDDVERLAAENELRAYWTAFCDADPLPISKDEFTDRMERAGFITLRKVTKADLQESFAAERGIEKGGFIWVLTNKGSAALKQTKPPP